MADIDLAKKGQEQAETIQEGECLAVHELLCEDQYTDIPEKGIGALKPLNALESGFNWLSAKLPAFSALLILMIAVMITIDVVGRLGFDKPWRGITELELLLLPAVGFLSFAHPIINRQSMEIDLFYGIFPGKLQRCLYLFSTIICTVASIVVGYRACVTASTWTKITTTLELSEWPFVLITGIGLFLAAIAFFFQFCHIMVRLIKNKEFGLILIGFALAIAVGYLPFAYKAMGLRLSSLAIGGIGFLILMVLLLLRVPIGFAMAVIGIVGLLIVARRPSAAMDVIGSIPFLNTANFMMIAFPMFLLMGEMVTMAGLSEDLFSATKKFFGRFPGGLAVATVGGCAGFGAVCGDSMATVITMSTVAMPSMKENHYYEGLSCGALAAGGTLGILIPPSMGFIVFSMITEESVGKLFVAGIVPGLLLASIFIGIIIIRVLRHPDWAPKPDQRYSIAEKMRALVGLIPVVGLFVIVVGGLLEGWFTPAEGGAIGAVLSLVIALARRRLTVKSFKEVMFRSAVMFGKLFALFMGLYILLGFLSASRLPKLLADTVAGLDINKYWVLTAVIVLYIFLGCVMNILPMMMLTLPTIYPTVMALGFDSVWFGVVCVVVMEMGMITPPVGMNVFTLAGLHPEIPMTTMFKGVIPFFFGMILCVILLILFPQIALCLL
ncbi:MAG: TRAP transporter large permease subunit [Mailhella sp.]|nr:TRAP transporter large permease subunit [Mailhella sp.]